MRRYNGWQLSEEDDGPLVKYSDVIRLIRADVLDMDAEIDKLRDQLRALKNAAENVINNLATLDCPVIDNLTEEIDRATDLL